MTHIEILNILFYIYLLFFLILFLFNKKITKPKWDCWGVFYLFIELDFFFYIVKKIVLEKSHVIKLYKIQGHICMFDWLTWFTDLTSLNFLFFNFLFLTSSIELVFDFTIVYFLLYN
jgi:hypothetical protein